MFLVSIFLFQFNGCQPGKTSLIYTVTHSSRGLLTREKRTKIEELVVPPPPPPLPPTLLVRRKYDKNRAEDGHNKEKITKNGQNGIT